MATTTVMDLPVTWTLLASGQADVLVQLRSIARAEVFVGADQPADDDEEYGVLLDSVNGDSAYSAAGLGATDNVYGRSLSGETERVAVMTNPPAA